MSSGSESDGGGKVHGKVGFGVQDEEEPILEYDGKEKALVLEDTKVGSLATLVNIVKNGLTTGVLSMPYGMNEAGVLGAALCLVVLTIMQYVGGIQIVKCIRYVRGDTFKKSCSLWTAIGLQAYGLAGEGVVLGSLIVTLVGVIAAQLILTAETLENMVPAVGFRLWVLIVGFPVLALSLPDDLRAVAIMSSAGIVVVLGAYIYIFYFGFITFEVNIEDGDMLFNKQLASFVGIAAFSDGVGIVLPPFYQRMSKPHHVRSVLLSSQLILSSLYFILGYIGFMLFDSDSSGIPSNILLVLPLETFDSYIVQSALVVIVVVSMPISTFQLSEMVEYTLLHSRFEATVAAYRKSFKVLIITVALCLGMAIAIAIPSFGTVIGILGCVTISLLSFVLPPIFHLRLVSKYPSDTNQLSLFERGKHYAMITLGVLVMITGTVTSVLAVI